MSDSIADAHVSSSMALPDSPSISLGGGNPRETRR